MTNDDIMLLDVVTFDMYWQAITVIESQEMLKAFKVQDWPSQTRQKRSSIHRGLFERAYPTTFENSNKPMTTTQLADFLSKA